MKKETITIKAIVKWSPWYTWRALEVDRRKHGTELPYDKRGVYMVRKKGSDKRLFIGWSDKDLGRMIQECLHGRKDRPSLAGNRLRENEDLSKLEIRWVETERPLAVWEDLVKQHITEHSFFPKYIPTKKQKRHI